jgi:hypothetical protein
MLRTVEAMLPAGRLAPPSRRDWPWRLLRFTFVPMSDGTLRL